MIPGDDVRLAFITLSPEFAGRIPPGILDPDIPLPVELPPGETSFNTENLTLDMIIPGLIRLIAAGEPAEHLFYYRNCVLALRPEIEKELSGAALVKAKNGDFDQAHEIIRMLKALFPASPGVLFLAALTLEEEAGALERAGQDDEAKRTAAKAEKAYREALAGDEPISEALLCAAFFFMKQQDFATAREYFSEYAATAPDGDQKERALEEIRRIEQYRLDDEHYRNAWLFISSGEEERGMAELRIFLEKNSSVWNGWFLLGWALRRLGRWQDGAAAFRKALELGGRTADSRNELAICLIELGELDTAQRELESALAYDPENVKIISNLGTLYLRRGDAATAESFFRTVLELEPNDPLAQQFLKRIDSEECRKDL
ncbi:MAG: tetratricopeptide repeat protein [Spirochaetaceae bacterium]|jgi:Flp pilus assembly protein TadD|nr:tetratricopeptide repeat protein [Spirochaetaceae bacterium]